MTPIWGQRPCEDEKLSALVVLPRVLGVTTANDFLPQGSLNQAQHCVSFEGECNNSYFNLSKTLQQKSYLMT